MKKKFEFLVAALLLLVATAWAGKWTVDSFDNSPDPGDPDNYIAAEFSGGLKPVKPEQVTVQSGRLYVRQKFEDPFGDEESTYQIYQGRPTAAAKDLGKISLDGSMQMLLKLKLFPSKSTSGNDDLENVYYDGKDIFVEGDDPVYVNLNGKWEELTPEVAREYKISITSTPQGATVTVGSANKGATPVSFPVSSNKTVSVVVSKDGYYTAIKPITPSANQENITLTERKALANPVEPLKAKLQAALAAKDANALKNVKNDVQQALKNYDSDSKKERDAIMSKFPANLAKATNETPNDYSARQNLWTNTQAKERDDLNKEALNYFNQLKELAAEADASAAELDFNLKYEYIPNSAITLIKWGPKDVTADVEVSNSRVKYKAAGTRIGYGSVSRNELELNEEGIHGVLKIWDTPNENGKFASIYDIALFYNETPLQVLSKGSVTQNDATSNSGKTEKDLNSRIAKYSGKAAWDKRDQDATIAALRKGEIPDPSAKKAAPPPPPPPKEEEEDDDDAYYDEDEDEDEMEEERGKQEKRDYSRYGAANSATDIFGNTDEYLFWTGMVFAAAAIGTGIVGFMENMKYADADKALKNTKNAMTAFEEDIKTACSVNMPDNYDNCVHNAIYNIAWAPDGDPRAMDGNEEVNVLWKLNQYKKVNQATKDSYNKSRIIWFGAAGLSVVVSITLFLW
ncbi:MAG: PEGA domain-containing protein [Fibromonadales bacterium]|nr:PEGA domain-containing protein [Fibromonadales bacterium]